MTAPPVLFNLLPYRPEPTGLSRYVERLLAAWPERPLPLQLRLSAQGPAELSTSEHLPGRQASRTMRWLQRQALVQFGVPVRRLLRQHALGCIYSPYTDWLAALPQVPQVITCHDLTPLWLPNSRRAHWRSRVLLSRQLHRAALVVAISRTVADQLTDQGLPASRIAVVPNGVEPVVTPITAPVSRDCLVLARHARNKNLALALRGFAALMARCPSWPGRLLVVGAPDRCTSSLLRQQAELGIQRRVCWLDPLPQSRLESLMRGAFCLISPSLMEGFDYPLMEAQALGLPTLASRIPVHEELHGEAALLFETNDAGDTMAEQLLRLDREPGLWFQLSQAGRCNAARYSSQRQAQMLHDLLYDRL